MTMTKIPNHFIYQIIKHDVEQHKNNGNVVTRFPPEPNGYLHIGHAKSICLNFSMAALFHGRCHLRFDDTDPGKEDIEYIHAIQKDIEWLGFDWGEHLYHAAYYFEQLYDFAIELIENGKAYVCDLSPEQIREYRGTLTTPGKASPYRERCVEENLDLFKRMRAGEFKEGERVLRAKIDMASPNMNLRDPAIYRIRYEPHPILGDKWCIYPMYDFAHSLSDAIEGITHSLCTLEFEDHRPLYNWFIDHVSTPSKPRQIEFARLNLEYTVTSKRKLQELVNLGFVEGWDDPRMPTISGLRRRGYTPESIREFCDRIGISRSDNTVEMSALESCIRESLENTAFRAMAVLNPLKVIMENYPEESTEWLQAPCHPKLAELGQREIPFTRELYIDRSDFEEVPPKDFKRLVLTGEVRLRNAYVIRCNRIEKDPKTGEIIQLYCTYDPDTLGKNPSDRKVKGVVHWVSVEHAVEAEVRLYDRLFTVPLPANDKSGADFKTFINPESLMIKSKCYLEPSLAKAKVDDRFQFEREGYFCLDNKISKPDHLVFNSVVTLRDTWAKIQKK